MEKPARTMVGFFISFEYVFDMENYKKGILYAIITALLWSVLAIGLKVAVRVVEPVTIVWFRFSIAFFILLVFQLYRNPSEVKIFIKPPWILVLATICLVWNYLGFMLGIQHTSPTIAQIFVQVAPISLALMGVVFFREKISNRQITGFAIAIAGLLIFYYQQFEHLAGAENDFKIGVLLTVSSALAWAIYASIQKKLVVKHTTSSLNLFVFGFSVILFLPFIHISPVFEQILDAEIVPLIIC